MHPILNFFCELDTPELINLFQNEAVIPSLRDLNAGVSLSIVDFSEERAEIVQRLNEFSIPVAAWFVFPGEQDSWSYNGFTSEIFERYESFKEWTIQNGLSWSAIGLAIEPDKRFIGADLLNAWKMFQYGLGQTKRIRKFIRIQKSYQELASKIRTDGFDLETYLLPILIDGRLAKSNLLQRLMGIPRLESDREVFLLYSSFIRPHDAGFVWSYAKDASYVALGSTGLSVKEKKLFPPLSWPELERDLRLAWHWTDEIYIFNLEGCVQQGFLEKLLSFEWDKIMLEPLQEGRRVDRWRIGFQMVLWLISYAPFFLIAGLVLVFLIYPFIRKRY